MDYFMPCSKTVTNEEIARLFMDNIYRYQCLLDDIISDHGLQFTSKFWHSKFKILKVKIKLSSTHHPQTDGQTEGINQVLEQYLHRTINYRQINWIEFLSLIEFPYNNTIPCPEQGLPFITFFDLNQIISSLKANFYINFGLTKLIKKSINK
jgi:hypothetical protein